MQMFSEITVCVTSASHLVIAHMTAVNGVAFKKLN